MQLRNDNVNDPKHQLMHMHFSTRNHCSTQYKGKALVSIQEYLTRKITTIRWTTTEIQNASRMRERSRSSSN